MKIVEILNNKKDYMTLLLLGDESEKMIDRYIERGRMFVLFDDEPKAACVVTDEGNDILEIKNIAVAENAQKQGYGKKLIEFYNRSIQKQLFNHSGRNRRQPIDCSLL